METYCSLIAGQSCKTVCEAFSQLSDRNNETFLGPIAANDRTHHNRRLPSLRVSVLGRRSLPRVDKNIDLSEYYFTLADMPDDWTPMQLFEREAPIELEVGTGKGLFMQTASTDHPDRNFVGIEIAGKYSRFAAAKLARNGLTNGKMLYGDAMRLITQHVPDESLDAVHVYFPDPWWKKRHFKRRIMNDTFLKHVQRTLKPNGLLHFWTDVQEYFDSALIQVAESTTLDGPQPVEEKPAEHDLDYRTHFERRMRKHDNPVYRSLYVKK